MKFLYAISDIHLSFGVSKSMDIFTMWENYTERLQKNWSSLVKSTDTVVINGDISWGMNFEEILKDFVFLESLPGQKIILKGNHDFWWKSINKINIFLKENNLKSFKILQNNFIEVEEFCVCGSRGWIRNPQNYQDKKICAREVIRLKLSIDSAKNSCLEKIIFLHYPPIYDNEIFDEIIDIMKVNNVKKCYYGHIHSEEAIKKRFEGTYKGITFTLVSCDHLDFIPKLVI